MYSVAADIVTMAKLSLAAYQDTIAQSGSFAPADIGLPASGTRNSVHFTFANGIYKATAPGSIASIFDDRAVANIYTKSDAQGHVTLAIAFRGTDGFAIDKVLGWGPQMKDAYYPLYKPLINAVKTYVATHNVTNVLVTGHSLGAAMAQYAMNDFANTAKTKYHAAIFGSPGAPDSGNAPDDRMLQFEYSNDAFTKLSGLPLVDFDRQGQIIRMPLDSTATNNDNNDGRYEHRMELYLNAVQHFANLGNETPWFMRSTHHAGNTVTRAYAGGSSDDSLNGSSKSELLFGGAGNDTLYGLAGNDRLSGGEGNDRLIGGAGADNFVFRKSLIAANTDRISDFTHGEDRILLDDAIFSFLQLGRVGGTAFASHLHYNTTTGHLSYAADDTGPRIHFATLSKGLIINGDDFWVI